MSMCETSDVVPDSISWQNPRTDGSKTEQVKVPFFLPHLQIILILKRLETFERSFGVFV